MKLIAKSYLKSLLMVIIKTFNVFWPKQKIVIFNSFPDLSDNALAYHQYLRESQPDWNTVWFIQNFQYATQIIKAEELSNIKLVKSGSLKAVYYFLCAKVQVDTHGAGYWKFERTKLPLIISLWHGSPIKKIGKDIDKKSQFKQDLLTSGADYFNVFYRSGLASANCKIVTTGYPRNDWLTGKLTTQYDPSTINCPYIVWMPTYVISKGSSLGNVGNFNDGEIKTDCLSFLSQTDMVSMDAFLAKLGMKLVVKLHPFDILNEHDFNKMQLNNFLIIKADDPSMCGSRLYGMLKHSNALITDYSSVIFDYICTNKPIGIDMNACARYTRAKYFEYDLSKMPARSINSMAELMDFCSYASQVVTKPDNSKSSAYLTQQPDSFSSAVFNTQMSFLND
ncbi:CDP-glycerol glycerophosphotransferase family protein [Escherichia coli]